MPQTVTIDPLAFTPEEEQVLKLGDATATMPRQVSPALWSDKTSPLLHCYRVYVGGSLKGVIGQASPSAQWDAMVPVLEGEARVGHFASRAEAIRFVAPETAPAQAPTRAPRKDKTVTLPQNPATIGQTYTAKYKGQTYTLTLGAEGFTIDGREGTFKSLSTAGKAVTGRVSCEGPKFWTPIVTAVEPTPEAPAAEAPVAKAPRKARTPKADAAPKAKAPRVRRVKVTDAA